MSWLVTDGEEVSVGQELVEIETDDANMVFEADTDGLVQTIVQEDDTLPIGTTIAWLIGPAEEARDGERPPGNGDGPG